MGMANNNPMMGGNMGMGQFGGMNQMG